MRRKARRPSTRPGVRSARPTWTRRSPTPTGPRCTTSSGRVRWPPPRRTRCATSCADLLARIGRSHFELVPSAIHDRMTAQAGAGLGSAGLEITPIGGEAVVWRVDPRGPAAAAGVKPGWVIEAIGPDALRSLAGGASGTNRVADFRLWATTHALLRGASGSSVRLRVKDEIRPDARDRRHADDRAWRAGDARAPPDLRREAGRLRG